MALKLLINILLSIENIQLNLSIDISILNHLDSRRLFKDYEKFYFDTEIQYNAFPDINSLKSFMSNNNFSYNINKLINSYKYTSIFIG